jgi:hypothetical protein
MSKTATLHVTGTTPDQINASFEEAMAHYTPAGKRRPNGGVTQRLRRESHAAFAALDASGPAEAPQSPPKPPRSARAATAKTDADKATAPARKATKAQAEQAAASDHVDTLIAEAHAQADDPYARAMALRQAANNSRPGHGQPVSNENLEVWLRDLLDRHPDYDMAKAWKVGYWIDGFAFTRTRLRVAWEAVTGQHLEKANRGPKAKANV